MRIAFVQTYPVYHDLWSTEQWLALENRDKWMPGIAEAMGHEVELWAVDHATSDHHCAFSGFGSYPIRLFARAGGGHKTKFQYSDALVEHARRFEPDLCVLKGVDGGMGRRLIEKYLRPEQKDFAVVIGGDVYYDRHMAHAQTIFYESDKQRTWLQHPGWRFWRSPVQSERLIRLPKSIDTEHFKPLPEAKKEWDVLAVCRLIPYKNPETIGPLSEKARVAVIGTGPLEPSLRKQYPNIEWLGQVENRALPSFLNRARVFMHPGLRDHYPRVLAEAAACGTPSVAFAEAIAPDVLPPECGLRVTRDGYIAQIIGLLGDPDRLERMSRSSREHAVAHAGRDSARPALEQLFDRLSIDSKHTADAGARLSLVP